MQVFFKDVAKVKVIYFLILKFRNSYFQGNRILLKQKIGYLGPNKTTHFFRSKHVGLRKIDNFVGSKRYPEVYQKLRYHGNRCYGLTKLDFLLFVVVL